MTFLRLIAFSLLVGCSAETPPQPCVVEPAPKPVVVKDPWKAEDCETAEMLALRAKGAFRRGEIKKSKAYWVYDQYKRVCKK
jgi:hypothetical protein